MHLCTTRGRALGTTTRSAQSASSTCTSARGTCRCTPNYFVCLEDAERMCSCDASQRTLVYRRTLAELEDMYANLLSRVEGCDVARKMSEDFGKYGSETPRRARQAEAWCREAVALLKEGCAPKRAVEDQIDSASKFLWGGHAMDEVRDHVTELEAALEWGRRWQAASPRRGGSSSSTS